MEAWKVISILVKYIPSTEKNRKDYFSELKVKSQNTMKLLQLVHSTYTERHNRKELAEQLII